MDLALTLLILGLGFIGSVVSGLLGVGGAAIIIPLLLYVPPWFGLEPLEIRTATAIAVTHVFFSTSSGAVAHARYQQVNRQLAVVTSVGTVFGALAGGMASKLVSGGALFLLFAITVTLGALMMLLPAPPAASFEEEKPSSYNRLAAATVGVGVGVLIGLLGAGAFMLVPLMRYVLRVPTKLAIGTGLVVAAVSSAGGFLGKLLTDQIPLVLAGAIVFGALPGAQVGSWIGQRVSGRALRRMYAFMITAIAAGLWYDLLHNGGS